MVNALSRRGPDDSDVWIGSENRCVLGHTRLSIIDVAGSGQPMTNEDGTIVLTYNGEIYNYRELRRLLVERGHTFRTKGDAEVLVHLYEEYGPQMVKHLDGMFAFSIYDAREHTMMLGRDRIGIKPLYYWNDLSTGELLFASDMNAILKNPGVPRRLNRRSLAQYLHFGFVVHPETWCQGVNQLEPGQIVTWKAGKIERSKYYQWEYNPCADLMTLDTATHKLRQVLSESVASHLMTDVPLGSFLSGGLDSATVTAFAQQARQASGGLIDSFTVRFWVPEYDESLRAQSVARDLGTHHTEIDARELPFDRGFMNSFIEGLGEPFADFSALAVYVLCQQARQHVKVALSGDGGDELFYGYPDSRRQRVTRRLRWAPVALRRVGANITANTRTTWPRKVNRYLRWSLLDNQDVIIDYPRRWDWSDLRSLLGMDLFQELFPWQEELFPEIRAQIGGGEIGGFLEQQVTFNMRVTLPCEMLFKVDRMSMANGLEVRVPMLANDMLEYGRQLPLKVRTSARRPKEPLRTLAETVSATLAQPAPKRGFGFPLDLWISGKVAQYWREWEITSILCKAGFQAREIDQLVSTNGHLDGTGGGYATQALLDRLFDLLLLAVWMDNYQISV